MRKWVWCITKEGSRSLSPSHSPKPQLPSLSQTASRCHRAPLPPWQPCRCIWWFPSFCSSAWQWLPAAGWPAGQRRWGLHSTGSTLCSLPLQLRSAQSNAGTILWTASGPADTTAEWMHNYLAYAFVGFGLFLDVQILLLLQPRVDVWVDCYDFYLTRVVPPKNLYFEMKNT